MDWRDEGLLLSIRDHGESAAIIDVLTAAHGRHSGLVRGGAGQRLSAVLQPGAQLAVDWRGRLEEHLGHFRVEPLRSRAAGIMADRGTLAAFNAMASLILTLVPERGDETGLHDASVALADALAAQERDWPAFYALWELRLLESVGFGLDLERCAVTGSRHDLAFVSPRTGRAVSRAVGGPWADKLLPLPAFLAGAGRANPGAVREALRLTGWFLIHRVCPALERGALPEARERLVRLLDRLETPAGSGGEGPSGGGPRGAGVDGAGADGAAQGSTSQGGVGHGGIGQGSMGQGGMGQGGMARGPATGAPRTPAADSAGFRRAGFGAPVSSAPPAGTIGSVTAGSRTIGSGPTGAGAIGGRPAVPGTHPAAAISGGSDGDGGDGSTHDGGDAGSPEAIARRLSADQPMPVPMRRALLQPPRG